MGGFCIKPHWLFAATLRLCSELIANRELAKEVAFVFVIKIFFLSPSHSGERKRQTFSRK